MFRTDELVRKSIRLKVPILNSTVEARTRAYLRRPGYPWRIEQRLVQALGDGHRIHIETPKQAGNNAFLLVKHRHQQILDLDLRRLPEAGVLISL